MGTGAVSQRENPVRAYKLAKDLTCPELAVRLGCSLDTAKKLVAGHWWAVSSRMAQRFERRTGGELLRDDVLSFAARYIRPPRRRRRIRRRARQSARSR